MKERFPAEGGRATRFLAQCASSHAPGFPQPSEATDRALAQGGQESLGYSLVAQTKSVFSPRPIASLSFLSLSWLRGPCEVWQPCEGV